MRRRETNFVVSVSIAGETRVARASWQQPWQPSNVAIGNTWLVGGFNPSEKYDFVSWDDYSQYMEK
jgi:hypothetical protein